MRRFSFIKILVLFSICINLPNLESQDQSTPPVTASLLCARNKIKANDVFWILVDFKIQPGWYLYWNSKENAGKAPSFQLNVPKGFMKGDIFWPTPKKITNNDISFWGYETTLSIPIQIQAANDLKDGANATITCDVQWVAVGKSNIPGNAQLSLTLPVSEQESDLDQKTMSLFQKVESHMHRQGDTYQVTSSGKTLTISITSPTQRFIDIGEIFFVPETESLFESTSPISHKEENDSKKITVTFPLKKAIGNKQDTRIRGILVIERKGDYSHENEETWWIDSVV